MEGETDFFDRQPPADIGAEQQVIGSLLLRLTDWPEIASEVEGHHFYDEYHRTLFEAIGRCYESGEVSRNGSDNFRFLKYELTKNGKHHFDAGFIGELLTVVGSGAHGVYYAQKVREQAARREMIEQAAEAIAQLYDNHGGELATTVAARLTDAAEQVQATANRATEPSWNDKLHGFADMLENGGRRGESMGFADLDDLTGGAFPGELIVIAGRPSHGKTTFAMNLVRNFCRTDYQITNPGDERGNRRVAFFSLEMSDDEMIGRALGMQGIPTRMFRAGEFSADWGQRVVEELGNVSQWRMELRTETYGLNAILAEAQRLHRSEPLDAVFVDYLQLVEPDDKKQPRQEQVATMSRRFKRLAQQLGVPVFLLAQVNRGAGNNERIPKLSELRESGAIEQDADAVFFVHRPWLYTAAAAGQEQEQGERFGGSNEAEASERQRADPSCLLISVAKQRNGPVGVRELVLDASLGRISNRAPQHLWDQSPEDTGEGF